MLTAIHELKLMLIAKHGVKLHSVCYTRSDCDTSSEALCSLLYMK